MGNRLVSARTWLPRRWVLLTWLLVVTPHVLAQQGETERTMVNAFHQSLQDAREIGSPSQRATALAEVIASLYDLSAIARFSLGGQWKALSDVQRAHFTEVLADNIVATYVRRFAPADPPVALRFAVLAVQQARGGIVVQTELFTATRQVRLDYFFRNGKVFNVSADGVSDLSLRRAEYTRILQHENFAALVAYLQTQTEELMVTANEQTSG